MKKILLIAMFVLWAPISVVRGERKPWPRRPGVVLYQLRPEATTAQKSALEGALRGYHGVGAPSTITRRTSQAITFSLGGRDEEDVARDLVQTGAVAFAEPDYLMPMATVPNDPGYPSQWYHATIHSAAAWSITTGAPSVTVAVCDTGVDASHADLAANMSLPGFNAADGTSNTSPIADHGTAVAGIIDAVGNNGIGTAGIAWNVKLLPVRISNNPDGSAWCSDMASGVEWAADHGAKVINLSYDVTGCPQTIDAAAHYAEDKGAVTFVAAGNSGLNLSGSFPSTHAFILVGASDTTGQRASFSNMGTPIDLIAPGVSIYAPVPGNSYAYGSGTSFSSPISAGVAALLFSLNGAWTPQQIRILMLANAQSLPASLPNGYGALDANAVLLSAENVLAGGPMPILPTTPGSGASQALSNLDDVVVYPNPWRADRHGSGIPIAFDSLTDDSTVKIFTISGFLIRSLTPTAGKVRWDLKNESGDGAASGIYLYSITDSQGNKSQGKLAIIR